MTFAIMLEPLLHHLLVLFQVSLLRQLDDNKNREFIICSPFVIECKYCKKFEAAVDVQQ